MDYIYQEWYYSIRAVSFAFCFVEVQDDIIPGGGPVCTCLVF